MSGEGEGGVKRRGLERTIQAVKIRKIYENIDRYDTRQCLFNVS